MLNHFALFLALVSTVVPNIASSGEFGSMTSIEHASESHALRAALLTPSIIAIFLTIEKILKIPICLVYVSFILYVVTYCLSGFYSVSPFATLGKGSELIVCSFVVFACILGDKESPGRVLSDSSSNEISFYKTIWTIEIFVYACLVYTVGEVLFYPAESILSEYQLLGSRIMSSNGVGYAAIFLLILVLCNKSYLSLRRSSKPIFLIGLTVCLLLSGSRTSWGIATAFMFLYIRKFPGFNALQVAAKATVALAIALSGWLIIEQFDRFGNNQSITLSGRTEMWRVVLEYFDNSESEVMTGLGGGVGGRYILSNSFGTFDTGISTTHSGIFEVIAGVGIIGGGFWCVFSIWILWFPWHNNIRSECLKGMSLLLIAVTIMSGGLGGSASWQWALGCAILLFSLRAKTLCSDFEKAKPLVP